MSMFSRDRCVNRGRGYLAFMISVWALLGVSSRAHAQCQPQWFPASSGTGDSVAALTVYNGNLIAGTTSGIAQWNGTSWSALGTGINGQVNALTVNGNLIAGGYFTTAGGTTANHIAQWNGTSWSALGTGINNAVNALTVYNG